MLALWLLFGSARELLFSGVLDASRFHEAIDGRLSAGDLQGARQLVDLATTAWTAQLAGAMLGARHAGFDSLSEGLTTREDLRSAAAMRLHMLKGLGRIAPLLALLGVILELSGTFGKNQGLMALQRGLVVSVGLSHAVTMLALGLMTMLVCQLGNRLLQRRLNRLTAELETSCSTLGERLTEVVKGET